MKWTVLADYVVTWPSGEYRAGPGETFEAFDDHASAKIRRAGQAYLRGQEYKIVPAPEDADCIEQEIPEEFAAVLLKTEDCPPAPEAFAAPVDRQMKGYKSRSKPK